MTPALFDLPLGLGDAALLAEVLLDICGAQPKPVSDEQRNRAASRLAGAAFSRMRVYIPSLERDPVHSAALYVCVDGVDGQPLLLRAAPATSPSSGLFPKSILIGRTRLGNREAVLNATPFGPGDTDRIEAFSEHVNKAFQPRAAGSRPLILVRSATPAEHVPAAFAAFRRLLKSTGLNQAAFGVSDTHTVAWSAIRAGWREGYVLESPNIVISRIVEIPAGTRPEDVADLIL